MMMMMMDYLSKILREAHRNLLLSQKPLDYLASRGVTESQISELQLGYFPDDTWPPYVAPSPKASDDEAFYLSKSGRGVKLKGKLLFPLTNALGAPVGFQVRTPNPAKKDYWKFHRLHSEASEVFFGTKTAMASIWSTREIVLVEGIFDLFPVRLVYPNSVCLGTANMSKPQARFIRRYANTVRVMVDNDEYGDKFFARFLSEHGKHFDHVSKVRYLGKDPSDSYQRLGKVRFMRQLASL